ncbi:transposase [Lignipirellula cremea]|uniref:transposase n=1 Tax=Lignipirellula cremea TaxID=2528010 RepID=UPI0037043D31
MYDDGAKEFAVGCERSTQVDGKMGRLTALELIRRFLLHVLPKRFVRIRYDGLIATRHVVERLARCGELLAPKTIPALPEPSAIQGSRARATCAAPSKLQRRRRTCSAAFNQHAATGMLGPFDAGKPLLFSPDSEQRPTRSPDQTFVLLNHFETIPPREWGSDRCFSKGLTSIGKRTTKQWWESPMRTTIRR